MSPDVTYPPLVLALLAIYAVAGASVAAVIWIGRRVRRHYRALAERD